MFIYLVSFGPPAGPDLNLQVPVPSDIPSDEQANFAANLAAVALNLGEEVKSAVLVG